jgi:hypothetical protein
MPLIEKDAFCNVVIFCCRASRSIKGPVDDTPQPPIKIQEVKAARTLASEITQGGAKLYDLLSAETKNRQERLQALRFMDQAGVSSGNCVHVAIVLMYRDFLLMLP